MRNLKHLFKFLIIVAICSIVLLSLNRRKSKNDLPDSQNEVGSHIRRHHSLFKVTSNKTLKANEKAKTKRIILWNTVFGSRTWGFPNRTSDMQLNCPDNIRCIQSINRSNPLDGEALVFHMRDEYTIPKKRDPHQVYVMYGWESPAYRGSYFVRGGTFYNWTITYSKKSEISFVHGNWFKLTKRAPDALTNLLQLKKKRPNGTATVTWVVSNCAARSHRNDYVTALKNHIAVDVFGKCGKQCPTHTGINSVSCFKSISEIGQYKFYLAFENSACQDYVSLKPFRALQSGMVPIVLGGLSADDYVGLFPPNAYLDVRNFTSPKQLAEYLNFLDKNDDKYLAYHAWRTDYSAQEGAGNIMCLLCAALHNSTMMSTSQNVNWGEFWNEHTKCDANLVTRLLARKDNLKEMHI